MEKMLQMLVQAITNEKIVTSTYDAARIGALTYIEQLFGKDSDQLIHAKSVSNPERALRDRYGLEHQAEGMRNDLVALSSSLVAMDMAYKDAKAVKDGVQEKQNEYDNKKVFIVHGHNFDFLTKVEKFLEAEGLEPIVLQDKANSGRTLIEKFIEYSDVGFAVILLTADDIGKSRVESDDKYRARQNVILELGYFIGRMGRSRTAVLFEKGVETPSDISGLVYIPIDNPRWGDALKLELQSVGMVSPFNDESSTEPLTY